MTTRILLVCLGNICRSPAAEGVLRVKAKGLDVAFDSAGTGDWHIGNPPHGPMQKVARARGYDLSALRARQIDAADFDRFDLIVAMDTENLAALEGLRGPSTVPVRLFTEFAEGVGRDVPDPYFTGDYEAALDLIERCATGLVATLR